LEADLRKQLFADVLGGLPGMVKSFFKKNGLNEFNELPMEVQITFVRLMEEIENYKDKLEEAINIYSDVL
jgi:hypothetical protein